MTIVANIPQHSEVSLFGYSGGGVVALQLASQLKEKLTIKSVVVAGTPIDVDTWIEANGYSKLNIENYTDALRQLALASVPVVGIFGDKDTTVSDLYLGVAVESGLNLKVHIVSNADHGQLVNSKSTLDILLNL